ncbi:MAG TPA: hypothetical protein DCZ92_10510 [Elusimicrobia bacterium]|nr:hypothetical protein [Elusimicrobiota bacterium]
MRDDQQALAGLRGKLPALAGWAAFAAACSVFFLPASNPDIFWHLSAGRFTVANWGPPRADFLSWPLAGAEWADFEWLPQIAYYLLYKVSGFKALVLFKGLLLTLMLLVFRRLLLLYRRHEALPFALPFLAAAIAANSDLRPDNFTLLFFTITLYYLERSRLQGFPGGKLFPLYAALFFAGWANIHAGYLYGLALVGFYAAGSFAAGGIPAVKGGGGAWRQAPGVKYSGYLLLGLAASMLNPYGWKIYAVALDHNRYMGDLGRYISEWGASSPASPYQWPYYLALAAVLPSLLFFVVKQRRAVYAHIAAVLFFAWVSAGHVRHIPFFMLTGLAFLLALPWEEVVSPAARRGLLAAGLCLFLPLGLWYYQGYIWSRYTGRSSEMTNSSAGLADFLKENKAALSGLRLYNSWGWGGWLGWEAAPDYKVFMDGRYLFHGRIAEFLGQDDLPKWEGLLTKYGFELMLVPLRESPPVEVRYPGPGGLTRVSRRPAYLFYLPKKSWAVVYWDRRVAALVKRAAVPAGWLAANEYKYLRPLDLGNLAEPVLAGELPLSEIRKELDHYQAGRKSPDELSGAPEAAALLNEFEIACRRPGAKCAGLPGGYSLKSQPR